MNILRRQKILESILLFSALSNLAGSILNSLTYLRWGWWGNEAASIAGVILALLFYSMRDHLQKKLL